MRNYILLKSAKIVEILKDKNFKDFLIYGGSNIISGLSPFILTPLLTKYLSPEAFGQYYLFLSFFSVATIFVSVNANAYITVNYNRLNNNSFSILISTVFFVPLFSITVFLVLFIVFFSLFEKNTLLNLAALSIGSAFFNSYLLYIQSYFQISRKSFLYLISKVLQTSMDLVLAFSFFYFISEGLYSRVFSHLSAFFLTAFLSIMFLIRLVKLRLYVSKCKLRDIYLFSVPLIPHGLSGVALMSTDRFVLSQVSGLESAGLFSSSMVVASLMMLIIEPINKTFAPWLLMNIDMADEELKITIVKITYLIFFLFLTAVVFLCFFVDFFYSILIDPLYFSSKNIFIFLVLGFLFQGMYYLVTNYLLCAGETKILSRCSMFSAFLGAILSYFLILFFGVLGAGISFMLVNALLFFLVWYNASKCVRMPWFNFHKGLK